MRITSKQIFKCINIKTHRSQGTCFYQQYDGKGALITASHIMDGVMPGENIYLRGERQEWYAYPVREIRRNQAGYDVCAFTITDLLWREDDMEVQRSSMMPGDPVRFLGFPHGLENTYPSMHGLATPLVRHAHLSGQIIHDDLYLTVFDGFNNPGYSGGPIYSAGENGVPILCGVIAGYRNEVRQKSLVYRDVGHGREEIVDGLFVKPNSGMIIASPLSAIAEAYEAIETSMAATSDRG